MPIETGWDLLRALPESQGVASAAILRWVEAIESHNHELHSFMLLRHGQVVAEGWWSPYQREYRHMLYSLSKSFTSIAVGLAINEGYFTLDDPVISFFYGRVPDDVNELLTAMQVRHLLSMTTGQAEDTWASMSDRPDGWIEGFFSVPVLHSPGTHFLYNTGSTYLLSAIVQKTTGVKLVDYLTPRLFEPLGIAKVAWEESPEGINLGGIGLSIKTEDMARFGQLLVQKGSWRGEQLVPQAWIEDATGIQVSNGDSPESDWTQGYGYQFWRCRHGAYRGDGVFGQYCIVMPEQDAVLVMTGGMDVFDMQGPLDLVWEQLLPGISAEPLSENMDSQQQLTEKLSNLRLQPMYGQDKSPILAQVSGLTYAMDVNNLNIEMITLDFSETGCTLGVKTASGNEMITCGYGEWLRGETNLFTGTEATYHTLIATSGAWAADDCYKMVIRLVETPFFYTLLYHFVGNEIMVEMQVNVSLQARETILLTGRMI